MVLMNTRLSHPCRNHCLGNKRVRAGILGETSEYRPHLVQDFLRSLHVQLAQEEQQSVERDISGGRRAGAAAVTLGRRVPLCRISAAAAAAADTPFSMPARFVPRSSSACFAPRRYGARAGKVNRARSRRCRWRRRQRLCRAVAGGVALFFGVFPPGCMRRGRQVSGVF